MASEPVHGPRVVRVAHLRLPGHGSWRGAWLVVRSSRGPCPGSRRW